MVPVLLHGHHLAAVDYALVYRSGFMNKVSSRKRERFVQALDSCPTYALTALILLVLLTSFYAVLLVNMNAIDTKTRDLREHPYSVTIAAGRAETLLMQIRTLDDRLAFTRTPETIASVQTEFAAIDEKLIAALEMVAERHRGNPDKADVLIDDYYDFRLRQQMLVELSLSDASDEEVSRFLDANIDPRIDEMMDANTEIIDAASQSFDRLYETVAETRADSIATATVLMAAVLLALVLFLIVIKRKNREQEKLQESLRRAVASAQEANEAKSRFLSNVSHDIRTPLTAIMGLTDIAMDHVDDSKRVAETLGKVQVSSHHLLNLVNDVLDMSKIESGQIDLDSKPFDVRAMVETLASIVRPQADTKHLSFSITQFELGDSEVMGDEMHVSQVLINLLGNAVKYTEPNGRVSLSVEELVAEERAEFVAAHDIDLRRTDGEDPSGCVRVIRFVVEDDGIGMSREFVSRMFDPFEREDVPTRLSVEGTGLGMSIVKNLVDVMGGTVEVESQRGHGSRFTLTLPFAACEDAQCVLSLPESASEASDAPSSDVDPSARSWSHVRVLLVEDNEIVGEIAEEIIGSTGATVQRAWNGFEALALLEDEPEGRFDLVFMDIQMPGMDGLEAASIIAERYEKAGRKRPPVIATTANAYKEDRQRALEAGMDGFAVKPLGKNEICSLFQSFVGPKNDE